MFVKVGVMVSVVMVSVSVLVLLLLLSDVVVFVLATVLSLPVTTCA